MKKIAVSLICVVCVFFITSCGFNSVIRNDMLDYYVQENNYIEMTGRIINERYYDDVDEMVFKIEILTENHGFPYVDDAGWGEFVVVNWSLLKLNFDKKGEIVFKSAPEHFYDDHLWPIVSIQQNGKDCLEFDDGKENYIIWIKETLK